MIPALFPRGGIRMNEQLQVAIVGRPNVGKSTLFNCLLKKRVAIVERFAGVTRDRISSPLPLGSRTVELVDTGGMGIPAEAAIADKVQAQIEAAMAEADFLLFVVDVAEGVTTLDEEVAELIRKSAKPAMLVANKADNDKLALEAAQFHGLGFGEPFPMSAKNKLGRLALIEMLEGRLGESAREAQEEKAPEMRIAVVGKRNAGKSTLVNALAGAERVIVSDVPGTTRDSIDVPFAMGAKFMVAVDTAGLRKKGKLDDSVEFFSRVRTETAIRTASVVLLLLDATTDITRVDKKLAAYVIEHGRPCVIVVNKWDLAEGISTQEFGEYVRRMLPSLEYAPVIFASALRGFNIFETAQVAAQLREQASFQVGTGVLNRLIEQATAKRSGGARKGPRPKIFYATQTRVNPPAITLFVNSPKLFTKSYLRYLEGFLRDNLPFSEIPLVIRLKSRGAKDA
jgi:GTP-binding protein